MSDHRTDFRRGAIHPAECLGEGWALIKDRYWLFLGITLVGTLIAGVAPFGILVGPMWCGIFLCLLRRLGGRDVKFEMLFRGFEHFVQGLIATLLMMIPMIVILVPAYAIFFVMMFSSMPRGGGPGAAPPPPGAGFFVTMLVFMAVFFVVTIVVSVLFFFVYPLIVDRKLSGVEAVKTSMRAAWANFGGVLGLTILTTLISFVGVLACYVGVFFVMPIHFAAIAVAYRKVFPGELMEKRYRDERGDYDDQPADEPRRRDDDSRRRSDDEPELRLE